MKKVTAIILTGILTLGVLTGCQSNSKAEEKGSSEDAKTIKVAASATPHAEILEQAKSILKKEGYQLEVTVFDDYVQPNEVVESGEFDANYFQHVPYLESFNEEKGTHLVDAGDIHYEHLEFIQEQKRVWMKFPKVIKSQCQMIRQMKPEHCFSYRTMELSH